MVFMTHILSMEIIHSIEQVVIKTTIPVYLGRHFKIQVILFLSLPVVTSCRLLPSKWLSYWTNMYPSKSKYNNFTMAFLKFTWYTVCGRKWQSYCWKRTGWMEKKLMIDWVEQVWKRHPGRLMLSIASCSWQFPRTSDGRGKRFFTGSKDWYGLASRRLNFNITTSWCINNPFKET